MRTVIIGIAALIAFFVIAAATSAQMGMMGDRGMMRGNGMMRGQDMMNMSIIRHRFVMMNGIGKEYASRTNPLSPTPNNITNGEELYTGNCATCHGVSGRGDGEAGKSLNPRPANIAAFSKMPMASDGYLYWTIAEGGTPLGTAMPVFKSVLSEEQIWEIILYLRRL
ncbi:MAG: cytochrome c [Gammaproteobacteria bacterium]|nr:cytochrome c [Gammaproteobacteria bacterium]